MTAPVSKAHAARCETKPDNSVRWLLRRDAVLARTGLSKSQLYALIAKGIFPSGIPLIPGGRAKGWIEAEVSAFIADRIKDARGRT